MEKVRTSRGQPSHRGWLKSRADLAIFARIRVLLSVRHVMHLGRCVMCLKACMAAGSLCGIAITRLLIGSAAAAAAADSQDAPVTSLSATAAALDCSVKGCVTGHSRLSLDTTTHVTATRSLVDVLVNQVHRRAISSAYFE